MQRIAAWFNAMPHTVHCDHNRKGNDMAYFIERRTMTDGDAWEFEKHMGNVQAANRIALRYPEKRAAMRAVINAELNRIATINARYEV